MQQIQASEPERCLRFLDKDIGLRMGYTQSLKTLLKFRVVNICPQNPSKPPKSQSDPAKVIPKVP